MKTFNEYALLFPNYDKTPKAVIAAIAFSLAMRLNDDNFTDADAMIRDEWHALHNVQIVPQKPPTNA